MEFPTMEEVKKADREQLCRWFRFLPSPLMEGEANIMDEIALRHRKKGGFTPEISEEIGWGSPG